VPAAPTQATAVAGVNSATVSWAPPAGDEDVDGYTIYCYDITAAFAACGATAVAGTPPATTATVTNLASTSAYRFTITASNDDGESSPSVVTNIVVPHPATPPNPPAELTAHGGDQTATISWVAPGSNGTPITGYTVFCTRNGVGCGIRTSGPEVTSVVFSGLENGVQYAFEAVATNAAGSSAPASSGLVMPMARGPVINDRLFQSAPIRVSGVYTPVEGDFNGDGRLDVFWYGSGPEPDALWLAANPGRGFRPAATRPVNGVYEPAVGDFDGDGFDDIFWYSAGSGVESMWRGSASGSFFGRRMPEVNGE
jgi:hypothetical protein